MEDMLKQLEEKLKIEEIKADLGGYHQKLIKNYILENADSKLVEKILKSDKGLGDCFLYVFEHYRQRYIAMCGQVSGGLAGDDNEMCSLAMHYFDEDSIKKFEIEKTKPVKEDSPKNSKSAVKEEIKKPVSKTKEVVKEDPKNEKKGEWNLFSFMEE